jgi:hypothetical protein
MQIDLGQLAGFDVKRRSTPHHQPRQLSLWNPFVNDEENQSGDHRVKQQIEYLKVPGPPVHALKDSIIREP